MNKGPALSSRAQAALLLHDLLSEHKTLDEALAARPLAGDDGQARFVMMLVLTALRHLGQIDALLATYIPKPLPDKRVMAINALRLGAVQLLMMSTPAHAATNETVNMVKSSKDAGLVGLVNAVMHKIGREMPELPDPVHNLPAWLRTRWEQFYGVEAVKAIAAVAAERPPLDLNSRVSFGQGERLDPHVWRLPANHESVSKLPGYREGDFWVQDIAATYPARLLGDIKGLEVLDIGAAPGGKTAQLARAGAHVTALDKSAPRMEILKENMGRLMFHVKHEVADALKWAPSQRFDAVLLDAPCSATGTWRRHPEVLAIATQHDITELARLQRDLLRHAWGWVKPGGRLVYCTCSLEPEEGEHQAAWFLGHHSDAKLEPVNSSPLAGEARRGGVKFGDDRATSAAPSPQPSPAGGEGVFGILPQAITPEGYLRTRPDMLREQGGMDGFFAAVFRKV